MRLDAILEERTSKKDKNKTYFCIVVKLTENVEKVVFLEQAEVELINLVYGKNK